MPGLRRLLLQLVNLSSVDLCVLQLVIRRVFWSFFLAHQKKVCLRRFPLLTDPGMGHTYRKMWSRLPFCSEFWIKYISWIQVERKAYLLLEAGHTLLNCRKKHGFANCSGADGRPSPECSGGGTNLSLGKFSQCNFVGGSSLKWFTPSPGLPLLIRSCQT